jgi:hypothetical protein
MTALMVRRMFAGALLGVVMTLSLAGVASAQSNQSSQSSQSSSASSGATTTTVKKVGATTTARTGAEMWIPLMLGGLVISVAVATRVGLTRAASRTS